uniref:Cupin domain-containing protein n=1 Tax=Candidatus Kentrum sp. MB TaxID=2138164 RepID=A0A450XRJ3_9GAMM|nr:MAG: Cupin domain-containing protein [Candidatus Kentron sp. MB]
MHEITIVNISDVKQTRGHCGLIRPMTTDGPARFVHLLVDNAERHYHKKTTEYYYVLNGRGQLYLDGEIYDIRKGDLVTIPPGTVHNAIEQDEALEIVVVEIPPAVNDVYRVER